MDRDGKFLRQWQPEGMETVHCMTMAKDARLCLQSRRPRAIQIYDKQGGLKKTIEVPWTRSPRPQAASPAERRPTVASTSRAMASSG